MCPPNRAERAGGVDAELEDGDSIRGGDSDVLGDEFEHRRWIADDETGGAGVALQNRRASTRGELAGDTMGLAG